VSESLSLKHSPLFSGLSPQLFALKDFLPHNPGGAIAVQMALKAPVDNASDALVTEDNFGFWLALEDS
jgi:hypothetical protein